MDPNACLQWIGRNASKSNRSLEMRDHCDALIGWINSGGFPPHWQMCPEGTKRFKKYPPAFVSGVLFKGNAP